MFNDQDKEFDKIELTLLDTITVNRDPNLDNEPAIENNFDDSMGEGTTGRFNQTLQKHLKVSVENGTYNNFINDKIKITDTIINK